MAGPGNQEPLAIVGLGCVLPDALGPEAFWQNVLGGRSSLRPLGGPTWAPHLDGSPRRPLGDSDKTHSQVAARIEGYAFDWRRFRIPPAEAAEINPLQLMILDAGAQALGGVKVLPRQEAGILLGATGLGWQRDGGLRIRLPQLCEALRNSPSFAALGKQRSADALDQVQRALDRALLPVTEDNVINASASVAAGRIAMHLDLHGLHMSIDASFASGLAALETGARLLQDGTLDLALIGGASELLTPLELIAMSRLGMLSAGESRPFDVMAQGALLGEGVALLAMKRLSDAQRDGETIYAVLRGVAGTTEVSSDDLCAVRASGLLAALRRTYRDAGLPPSTVGLWECDAAGIPAADGQELSALRQLLGAGEGTAALGSAKALLGHTRAASGAVGLLRAVLCLHHRTLPAQINFQAFNPALELARGPLYVPIRQAVFQAQGGASQPRAGVSAIGLGGLYYHAVLEAYSAEPTTTTSAPAPVASRSPRRAPIAITGMGGVFPGARSVPELWRKICEGYDATREVPAERWSIDEFYDPDPQRRDTTYTRLGCFLDPLPPTDPCEDPGQVLILQAAEEALADAGYKPGQLAPERVGVMLAFLPYQGKKFLADLRVNYAVFAAELEQALVAQQVPAAQVQTILAEAEARAKIGLPPLNASTMPGYAGSINAARIAARWGFRGPHFVVDSACASSLATLVAAVRALQQGAVDMVLCGGVWCDILPEFYVAACRFNALSATGSHPFSARADGFIPGEGGGLFVLRRLDDAEREGERIHAVISAVAGSSDGRGRSVLAPSPQGEALAMRRALAEAGVAAADIGYVECHGTGTPLGDAVEAQACAMAFGEGRRAPLLMGSVKSNIGHLNAAAGVPALIKAALAVQKGLLPPSLKSSPPSEKIDFTKVNVVRELTPWPAEADRPRRAGVSGFGVGGTNMHLIVEEHRPAPRVVIDKPPEAEGGILPIFAVRGSNTAACLADLQGLLARLQAGAPLAPLLLEAQRRAAQGPGVRVAIVAADAATLALRVGMLETALQRQQAPDFLQTQGIWLGPSPGPASAKVAVTFPGQGPQYATMLAGLLPRFSGLRSALATIDAAYERLSGHPLSPTFLDLRPGDAPPEGEDSHCAVFAVNCLLFALLRSFGLRCEVVLGQSAGELAALVAAGVLTVEDGLRAMRARTRSVFELDLPDPGQMVVLSCGASATPALLAGLPGRCWLAADNAPTSCIVSGDGPAVAEVLRRCAASGIEATRLSVSHAYHSPIIGGAMSGYRATLDRLRFAAPRRAIVSTISGGRLELPPSAYAGHLASQFIEPVRLRQGVEAAYAMGVRLFIECGPRWALTSFVGQILGDRPHAAQATMHPKIGEAEQLHRALACLFVHDAVSLSPQRGATERPLLDLFTDTEPPPMSMTLEGREARGAAVVDDRLARRPDVVTLLQNIQSLIGTFLAVASQAEQGAQAEQAAAVAPLAPAEPLVEPLAQAAPSSPAAQTAAVAPPAPAPLAVGPDAFERVRLLVLEQLMAKTGYPADMLDLDLDMEADLGIDTVRQVAIVGEVRGRLGLALDPGFKLRDHATIRRVIQYLVSRLAPEALAAGLTTAVVSPKAASVPPREARVSQGPGAAASPAADPIALTYALLAGARQRTPVGALCGIDDLSAPARVSGRASLIVQAQGPRCQLVSVEGAVALSGVVLIGAAPVAAAAPIGPEIAFALERRGRPRNGVALFGAARKAGGGDPSSETVVWAWSSRFDEVTGGLRLPLAPTAPMDVAMLAALCEGVFWLADFGWYGLSGSLYRLAGLRRVRLHRLPETGAELLVHVRLLSGPSAAWAADALVLDERLSVVASFEGLSGAAISEAASAVTVPNGNDGTGVAWQHFYRRMHQVLLPGEDHAW